MSGLYSQRFKQFEREHIEKLKQQSPLIQTQDTLSKAKKLSLETNKRRKANAIKRKLEAQKEEGRRKEILSKRKESQRQATEKYQRSHIRSRSPGDIPVLEEALKLVRGSSHHIRQNSAGAIHSVQTSPSVTLYNDDSDPLTRPYLSMNKYARQNRRAKSATNREHREAHQVELHSRSLKNLASSRSLFEQQLHQHQQLLKQQHQQTLSEFNEVLNKEIVENANIAINEEEHCDSDRSDSICSSDSLDDSKTSSSQRSVDHDSTIIVNENRTSSVPEVQNIVMPTTKPCTDSFYLSRNTSVDSISTLNSSLQSTHLTATTKNDGVVYGNATKFQINSQVNNDIQSPKPSIPYPSQVSSGGDITQFPGFSQHNNHQLSHSSYIQSSHSNLPLPVHSVSAYNHASSGQDLKPMPTSSVLSPHFDSNYNQRDLTSFHSINVTHANNHPSSPRQYQATNSFVDPRPSVQLRAWATPSPIDNAHSNTPNLTSNTKPQSSKSTATHATTTTIYSKPGPTNTVTYSQSTVVSDTKPTTFGASTTKSQSVSSKITDLSTQDVSSSTHVKLDKDVSRVNGASDKNNVKFEVVKNSVETKEEKNSYNRKERVGPAISAHSNTSKEKIIKSILKKSGTSVSQKPDLSGTIQGCTVRDSVEVAKTHLSLHTQSPKKVRKRGVRFADLTYDEDILSDSDINDDVDNEINKIEAQHRAQVSEDKKLSKRPPRPESARSASSQTKFDVTNKKSRASSATVNGQRQTDKPLNKPQGTAHIITHGSTTYNQNDTNNNSEQGKRVAVVSRNFMDKTPISKSNNVGGSVNRKATVYTLNETHNSGFVASQSNGYDGQPTSQSTYNGYSPLSSESNPTVTTTYNYDNFNGPVYNENGLRIDRTPTDDEINFLWEKVRTCLNRSASNQSISGNSDQMPYRQTAPLANKVFDGDSLGYHNGMRGFSSRSTNPNNNVHPNYLKKTPGSYTQKYGLLQQRRQTVPKADTKNKVTKHMPAISQKDPQYGNGFSPDRDVSESLAAFMIAEQLADQSLTGSQIQKAMENAEQKQQAYNSENTRQKAPTILSIEEQRLLESLDRLKEKLKLHEMQPQLRTDSIKPPPTQPAVYGDSFKGRPPLSAQQPRSGSAKTYNRSASATLPRRQLSAHHY